MILSFPLCYSNGLLIWFHSLSLSLNHIYVYSICVCVSTYVCLYWYIHLFRLKSFLHFLPVIYSCIKRLSLSLSFMVARLDSCMCVCVWVCARACIKRLSCSDDFREYTFIEQKGRLSDCEWERPLRKKKEKERRKDERGYENK